MALPAANETGLPAADGATESIHNSVLIRTHERHKGGWVAPAVVGVLALIGAGALIFVETQPKPPAVNHLMAGGPLPDN